MKRFKLYPKTETAIGHLIAGWYNSIMAKLARKAAVKMAANKNKAIYGIEISNAIHVMTSIEKRDIDKAMPRGNKMNIAKTLEYQTFLIYPPRS